MERKVLNEEYGDGNHNRKHRYGDAGGREGGYGKKRRNKKSREWTKQIARQAKLKETQ